jgi:hypothetical protein
MFPFRKLLLIKVIIFSSSFALNGKLLTIFFTGFVSEVKSYVLRHVATEHVSNFSMRPWETICFRTIALESFLIKKTGDLQKFGIY